MPAPVVPIDCLVNFENLRQHSRQTLSLAQTEEANKHGERVQPSLSRILWLENPGTRGFFSESGWDIGRTEADWGLLESETQNIRASYDLKWEAILF